MNHVLNRYVRGTLQVTRALGDLFLKRLEFYQALPESVRPVVGPPPFIPPYVSNTPEVVLRQVRSAKQQREIRKVWSLVYVNPSGVAFSQARGHLHFFRGHYTFDSQWLPRTNTLPGSHRRL